MGIYANEESDLPRASALKGIDAMRQQRKGVYINPSRDPKLTHAEQMAMRRMIKLKSRTNSAEVRFTKKELEWKEKLTAKSTS